MSHLCTRSTLFPGKKTEEVLQRLASICTPEDRDELLSVLPWSPFAYVESTDGSRRIGVGISAWKRKSICIDVPLHSELLDSLTTLGLLDWIDVQRAVLGEIYVYLYVGEKYGLLELVPAGATLSVVLDNRRVSTEVTNKLAIRDAVVWLSREEKTPEIDVVFPVTITLQLEIDDYIAGSDGVTVDPDRLGEAVFSMLSLD